MNAPIKHEPVRGDDFMPAGWCGGCDTCAGWTVPSVCLACSYPHGGPDKPVVWPCEYAPEEVR